MSDDEESPITPVKRKAAKQFTVAANMAEEEEESWFDEPSGVHNWHADAVEESGGAEQDGPVADDGDNEEITEIYGNGEEAFDATEDDLEDDEWEDSGDGVGAWGNAEDDENGEEDDDAYPAEEEEEVEYRAEMDEEEVAGEDEAEEEEDDDYTYPGGEISSHPMAAEDDYEIEEEEEGYIEGAYDTGGAVDDDSDVKVNRRIPPEVVALLESKEKPPPSEGYPEQRLRLVDAVSVASAYGSGPRKWGMVGVCYTMCPDAEREKDIHRSLFEHADGKGRQAKVRCFLYNTRSLSSLQLFFFSSTVSSKKPVGQRLAERRSRLKTFVPLGCCAKL